MGSSGNPSSYLLLAAICCLLFLVFDAVRYFAVRIGPVRLRRWAGADRAIGASVFPFSAQQASVITIVLSQISLCVGISLTVLGASNTGGLLRAAFFAAVSWSIIVVLWKAILALLPDQVAEFVFRAMAPVVTVFYLLFWPVLFPLRKVSERMEARRDDVEEEEDVTGEELQAYIDVGEEEGILEEGEGKLVQSIVDFGDRVARELMTPRIDMLAVDAEGSLESLAQLFSESKYSRIPLYDGSVDHIVGIVHIKDVFDAYLRREPKVIRELARAPYFIHETKKVSELLREFQIEHLQIAVVLDEYGGTAGLITIEDVIEEIVGEIADEHEDEEESIVDGGDGTYMINGLVRVELIEELFDIDLSGEDYETVAGLISTNIGRVPKVGERVSKAGLIFEVDRADRKRIYRIRVMQDPEWTAAADRNGRQRAELT